MTSRSKGTTGTSGSRCSTAATAGPAGRGSHPRSQRRIAPEASPSLSQVCGILLHGLWLAGGPGMIRNGRLGSSAKVVRVELQIAGGSVSRESGGPHPPALTADALMSTCSGGATTRSNILRRGEPSGIGHTQRALPLGGWSRLGIGAHALSRPPWPLTPILLCENASREVGMELGSAGVSSTSASLSSPRLPVASSPFPIITSGPRPSDPVLNGGRREQMNAGSRTRIGVFLGGDPASSGDVAPPHDVTYVRPCGE